MSPGTNTLACVSLVSHECDRQWESYAGGGMRLVLCCEGVARSVRRFADCMVSFCHAAPTLCP